MEIESLLKDLIKLNRSRLKTKVVLILSSRFKRFGLQCERIDYDNVENLYAVLGNEGL